MATDRHCRREDDLAYPAIVMSFSVIAFPNPRRTGWEREREICGWAYRESGVPRLSRLQRFVNAADAVSPEERSRSVERLASKKRLRSTKGDPGAAGRWSRLEGCGTAAAAVPPEERSGSGEGLASTKRLRSTKGDPGAAGA